MTCYSTTLFDSTELTAIVQHYLTVLN